VFAGVETGGTKVAVGVGSGPGDLRVATLPTTTPADTMRAGVRTTRELTASAPLAGIGVAAFGPVDLDPCSATYGHVTTTPKPHWSGTDLLAPLREAFDAPIGLDIGAVSPAESAAP
jgi:fructokinase